MQTKFSKISTLAGVLRKNHFLRVCVCVNEGCKQREMSLVFKIILELKGFNKKILYRGNNKYLSNITLSD